MGLPEPPTLPPAAAAAAESMEEERVEKGAKPPLPLLLPPPSPMGSRSGKVAVEAVKKAMCPRSTSEAFSMAETRGSTF